MVNLNLRLPPELHKALVEMAERDLRSLNAEILHILRRAVENDRGPHDA